MLFVVLCRLRLIEWFVVLLKIRIVLGIVLLVVCWMVSVIVVSGFDVSCWWLLKVVYEGRSVEEVIVVVCRLELE